jgi:hypothetical protein
MAPMSAQDIYENFHGPGAKGVGALDHAQSVSYSLADSFQHEAADTQNLIGTLAAGWTGNAASAATQSLATIAEHQLAMGDALNVHQDLVYRQAGSYQTAAAKVNPVPPAPSGWDVLGSVALSLVTSGVATIPAGMSIYNQAQNHNSVSQANVDAYDTYVQASTYNATSLPTMPTGNSAVSVPITVTTPQQQISAGRTVNTTGFAPRSHGVATTPVSSAPTSAAAYTPPPSAPIAPPVGSVIPSQHIDSTPIQISPPLPGPIDSTTTTSGTTAPPAVPPANNVVGGGGGQPAPIATGAVTDRSIGMPPGMWTGSPGGTGDIAARLGGGRLPATPTTAGPRSFGAGAGGAGAEHVVGGAPSSGARIGAPEEEIPRENRELGTATRAEEEAMANERMAQRNGGQMAGPMGAGHGAEGGHDGEHKRKYRLTEDSDVYTGTDKVAAQVIGESRADYEARIARDSGLSR